MRPELLAALRTELGSVFSAERAEKVRRIVLEDARDNVTQEMRDNGADALILSEDGAEDYEGRAAEILGRMIDALLTEG